MVIRRDLVLWRSSNNFSFQVISTNHRLHFRIQDNTKNISYQARLFMAILQHFYIAQLESGSFQDNVSDQVFINVLGPNTYGRTRSQPPIMTLLYYYISQRTVDLRRVETAKEQARSANQQTSQMQVYNQRHVCSAFTSFRSERCKPRTIRDTEEKNIIPVVYVCIHASTSKGIFLT